MPWQLERPTCTLSQTPARIVLALIIVTSVLFVAITFSPLKSGYADAPDRGPGDFALYRAEIDRVHAGEPYYAVAADELRTRGYPTRSIFNWRTPLPMCLVALLPDAKMGQAALVLLAVAMWLLAFGLLESQLGRRANVCGLVAISGTVLPCLLGDLFVLPEMWAGILIGLSAVSYGTERRKLGFASALAAPLRARAGRLVVPGLPGARRPRAALAERGGLGGRAGRLRALLWPARGPGAAADFGPGSGSRARLGALRRGGLSDLDGAGQRLAAARAAVGVGTVLRVCPGWSSRLDDECRTADRTGSGRLCRRVCDRGPAVQPVLGLTDGAALALAASAFPAVAGRLWRAACGGPAAAGALAVVRR